MIKLYFSSKKTSNLKQLLLIFLTLLIICKIATTKHAFIPHDNEQFISALCKAYKRLSGVCDLFSISNIFIFCCVFRQILIIVEFLSFFCLLCSSRNVGISGLHFHTDAYVFYCMRNKNILRASNYRDICRL